MDQFDHEIRQHMINNIDEFIESLEGKTFDAEDLKNYLFNGNCHYDIDLPEKRKSYKIILFQVMEWYEDNYGRDNEFCVVEIRFKDDNLLISLYGLMKFDEFIKHVFHQYLELDENEAKYKKIIRTELKEEEDEHEPCEKCGYPGTAGEHNGIITCIECEDDAIGI